MTNILIEYLKALNVPHTKEYSINEYNRTVFRNSLYGLSRLLSKYNVINKIVRFKDRILNDDSLPILIHFKNNFIIITSKEENGFIAIEDNGNKIHLKQMDLLTNWKGYAIKAYPSITSIEYNYSHHIKYHNKKNFFISIFLLAMILSLLFIIYINFNIYTKISVAIIMANLCATCAAFMSLLNYLSIPNVSTKLCNAIKFSNCNLGNTMIANKLFLNYLPALSVSYFSINLLLLLSFPLLTSCIFIVVIMASIMCVVSIIYQIYIRKLCILCCIIVLSIVCMDIISWPVFEFRPRTDIIAILLMLMAYFSGFILINYYVRNNRLEQTLSSSELEYNELKFSDVLLDAYFGGNQTSYINVNNSSTLVFGNVKAINELIIVSNPLCEACSIIHPYITHLINSGNYTVRYFF